VALLAALPELGFNITPVAAAAGLASLAVGFGGQHLVKDLINGFFIIFEDQYVVGDWIKVNGETGRVEHMTLRRTVMRTDRGAIVSIPCGMVGQVANLSRDWGQTYVDVTVPADEAAGPAIAVLEKVCEDLRNDRGWSAALVDGPRVLGIDSMTMDGTTVRIQLRSPALRQDEVARELRRRLKLALEQAHISLLSTRRVEVMHASPARDEQENSHNSLEESNLKEEIER
jgi:small conductance mechanosensitive channel